MVYLLQTFWDIFLLRKSPSELPYSKALFGLVLCLDVAANVSSVQLLIFLAKSAPNSAGQPPEISVFSTFLVVLASLLVIFSFLYIYLTYFDLGGRFVQTMTALMGLDLVLACLSCSVFLFNFVPMLTLFFFIVLMYWEFMVHTFIFSESFNISLLKACFFALIFLIVKHNVAEWTLRFLAGVG